nr:hypothetical protein [Candidatus Sigynarchaeota archaeon]
MKNGDIIIVDKIGKSKVYAIKPASQLSMLKLITLGSVLDRLVLQGKSLLDLILQAGIPQAAADITIAEPALGEVSDEEFFHQTLDLERLLVNSMLESNTVEEKKERLQKLLKISEIRRKFTETLLKDLEKVKGIM